MTVLPKKVFPHPTLAWSVVSELEEDPKECQCEIKCLVPVCGLASLKPVPSSGNRLCLAGCPDDSVTVLLPPHLGSQRPESGL